MSYSIFNSNLKIVAQHTPQVLREKIENYEGKKFENYESKISPIQIPSQSCLTMFS